MWSKAHFAYHAGTVKRHLKKSGVYLFLSQLKLDRSQFWKLGTGRVSYGPFLSRPLSCHSTFVLHLHTRCCWNWYSSTRLLEVYSPSKVWVVAIFSVGPDVPPVSCLIYRNYRRNGSTSRVGQIFPHYENLDNINGMFSLDDSGQINLCFCRHFIENAEGWKMRFVHCREKKKLRVSSENPIWRQKGRSGRISEPRRRISLWKSNFWCSGGSEQDRNRFEMDSKRMHICKISQKIIIWKVKRATSEEIKPG